ncbi:hypothetical protein SPRG_03864 [Saprolegnia parasitica CBS 223.65]|uniref:Uncharacterized protein n=1 Tax=Saprolegnia parasitica (strain CBS 223.65) TaxID=695850 RepID=A0A067CWT6_SAPPC|nr:hypothetical protein SPRG_03864 [Saprolegnia parasitica CBS 223.65]KDO31247.1 hypothetical protein SPRG_03864 [Saprolegnia parasitica CBS 223.65]|eukprot:XP_012197849.1 hypothetical protein SPRG_03864 [Saprolegnia parasitica CBS 223.65]
MSGCEGCSTRPCHVCRKCIFRHCQCGLTRAPVCVESQACQCVTLSRCRRCHGCQGRAASHCRCDAHAKHECLCEELRAMETDDKVDEDEAERQRVNWRHAIPTVASHLSDRSATMDSRLLYKMVLRPGAGPREILPPSGRRGTQHDTYLASVDLDPTTVPPSVALRSHADAIFARGMDNFQYTSAQEAAMPSEDLVDYVVHTASLKAVDVPELWGSLDASAAIVAAIVADEYARQLVDEYMAAGETFPLTSQDALVECIHELLNGAACRPDAWTDLASGIASEVRVIFGDAQLAAYDVPQLIAAAMQPLKDASSADADDPAWAAWKDERVRVGLEALQNGAIMSPDGIHVDTSRRAPSYWFCVAVPHGKTTESLSSARYPSYRLAFETKLGLEQRIRLVEDAQKMDGSAMPPMMPTPTLPSCSTTEHPWPAVLRPVPMPSTADVDPFPHVKQVLAKVALTRRRLTPDEAIAIAAQKELAERNARNQPAPPSLYVPHTQSKRKAAPKRPAAKRSKRLKPLVANADVAADADEENEQGTDARGGSDETNMATNDQQPDDSAAPELLPNAPVDTESNVAETVATLVDPDTNALDSVASPHSDASASDALSADEDEEDDEEDDDATVEFWCPKCGNDVLHRTKASRRCEYFVRWRTRKIQDGSAPQLLTAMHDLPETFLAIVEGLPSTSGLIYI